MKRLQFFLLFLLLPVLLAGFSAGCDLAATISNISGNTISVDNLPDEALDTIALIQGGGPFPYKQDGAVFYNREGLLPQQSSGYYHEYTVETLGSPDRGARRIVTGKGGEFYYTADHYASFKRIVE